MKDRVESQERGGDTLRYRLKERGGILGHVPYLSLSTVVHLFLIFLLFPALMTISRGLDVGTITTMEIEITGDDHPDLESERITPKKEKKKIENAVDEAGTALSDKGEVKDGGEEDAESGETTPSGNDADGGRAELLSVYILKIRDRIERKKRYPKAARLNNEEGTATVSFLLDASGTVANVKVVLSSGHDTLDTAALNTILEAAPYPPIPLKLRRKSLSLRVPIKYELK